MSALRKILVSIALACLALSTARASSARFLLDAPVPDSISGRFWQRVIDPRNPAAPPRLVRVHDSAAPSGSRGEARRPIACVRAGEHLLLHQTRTGSSTVSLAATVLQSGACGDRVRARIEVTGALTEITVLGRQVGILDRKGNKWR